jgi:hypothetical protein
MDGLTHAILAWGCSGQSGPGGALTLYEWLVACAGDDLEQPVRHVLLDGWVSEPAPDEALGTDHDAGWVLERRRHKWEGGGRGACCKGGSQKVDMGWVCTWGWSAHLHT